MYLNCHTAYSFRYGTFSEKVLLEMAVKANADTIALTDINNTSACLNFIRLAPNYGIKPVVGVDFRNGNAPCFVALAQNNEGFQAINQYLSGFLHQKERIPPRAQYLPHTYIVYPFATYQHMQPKQLAAHEFVGVRIQDLPKLRFSSWLKYQHKLVIQQTVTFRNRRDFNAHRLLRAIDNNTLLSKLDKTEEALPSEIMHPVATLLQHFQDLPTIVKNTIALLESCTVNFDFDANRAPQNQTTYTDSKANDVALIKQLAYEKLTYRYGKAVNDDTLKRIEKELNLIIQQGYVSYFLINWDIVQYAKRKGYYHVGRGSGANSVVAYLLGITDVDPMELDLYFERFMNLYRKNPPDFDIDFSWRDRQDVTKYIFKRFNHVALLATYNCFQYRGTVRELGKVFGLPKVEIDKISSGKYLHNRLDSLAQLVLKYSTLIQGLPNHLGVHAGGILIAQKPIHYFTATNLPPKGFATTQFDMVISEDVGLYKFDILGQRGLAKIKEAIEIIRYNQPDKANFDIYNIKRFKSDPKVNQLIKEAKCLGCFYVESPAMRMLLKKLEVDNYLGLVAASSIIRPGVSKSGMMREYILRHKNPERRKTAHPVMMDIMPETYGIMVYQEDVIKVAHHFAGLTLGEADVLRRGMSGKFRSREELLAVKQKFIDNCRAKHYADQLIHEIWHQIESFAGYAFAKGHSASYAVESYQALFLKTYFPLEYLVAVVNNGGGFYRKEIYLHEARMLGATVHPPDINLSQPLAMIQGTDIYLGFHFIGELNAATIEKIIQNRATPYQNLDDFMYRTGISAEQCELLIRAGCFRRLHQRQRALIWQLKLNYSAQKVTTNQLSIFAPQQERQQYEIPTLTFSDTETRYEALDLFGFTFDSPFNLINQPFLPHVYSQDLAQHLNKKIRMYGYLVTMKPSKTAKRERMAFGTFLDQNGHFIDTVHFPDALKQYPFRGKGIYRIEGKVTSEFDFLTVEATFLERVPISLEE